MRGGVPVFFWCQKIKLMIRGARKNGDETSVTPNSNGATGEPLKKSQIFRILTKSQAELLRLCFPFSCVFLAGKSVGSFWEETRETFCGFSETHFLDTSHEGRRTESMNLACEADTILDLTPSQLFSLGFRIYYVM